MKSFFKKIVIGILTVESRLVLKKYKPEIIAITGSVGKTSTKDAIYSLLSPTVHVRKSDKSFNSEIGLPLTILGCQNAWNDPLAWLGNIAKGLALIMYRSEYPRCLVLEVGADHPGDIKNLTKWFHPDIAVITAVSKVPVHVEYFSSPKAVLEEKLSLARGIKKTGKLVLPAGDADILAVRKEPELASAVCLTFGINSSGDVTASSVEIMYANKKPVGMSFTLNYAGNSVPVSMTGVVGFQHVYSMVAAAAVAIAYGVSFNSIVEAIPQHRAPLGRMNVLGGVKNSVLIDDSYNASPDAVREALAVLCDVKGPRKIAVLGDMMELGTFSLDQHKKTGEIAAHALMTSAVSATDIGGDSVIIPQTSNNILVTVGIRSRDIALGAAAAGMAEEAIQNFDTSTEAADFMKNAIREGDIVLIKGSQSPRLERVSRILLAGPDGAPADQSFAEAMLVRQEAEWLARS